MIKHVDDGNVCYDIGFPSNFSDIMIVEVHTHQLKLLPRSTCRISLKVDLPGGMTRGLTLGR